MRLLKESNRSEKANTNKAEKQTNQQNKEKGKNVGKQLAVLLYAFMPSFLIHLYPSYILTSWFF